MRKKKSYLEASIICSIVFIAMVAGFIGVDAIIIIPFSVIAIVLVILLPHIKEFLNGFNEGVKEAEIQQAADFYKKCKKQDASMDNIALLKSIAKECQVPLRNFKETYEIGRQEISRRQKEEEQLMLEDIQAKLDIGCNSKYIQGLTDTFTTSVERFATTMDKTQAVLKIRTNKRAKKRSWAIAGGIAEGIGGIGIGLATAMEVRRQNILAEQEAAETRANAYASIISFSYASEDVKSQANKVVEALKKYELKIRELTNKKENVNITYRVNSFEIRESGALLLNISPQNTFNAKKVLDGVLYAKIMSNNEHVGEAYIMSPGYLDKFEVDDFSIIESIGLENFKEKTIVALPLNEHKFNPNNRYKMEIVPIDIWEIDIEEIKSNYKILSKVYKNYVRVKDAVIREAMLSVYEIK